MFEFEENLGINAKIKVIGVGGGGGNAIKTMMKEEIEGVDFVAINTDVQSLKENDAMVKIQIGNKLTRGLGSGANPQVGREAAMEDSNLIKETLVGCDMVFITAGMGGGTGTGAVPIIAKIAKDLGILTVGVVTKPFSFEGRKRMKQAEVGIETLKEAADTLICIPNDNMLNIAGKDTPITDSFKMVDFVLLQAVRGISDLITTPGLINLDFADIRTIMRDSGLALMGTGIAAGQNRAIEAAKLAIRSPLLEDLSITGATGILLNITGSSHMTLFEVNEASKLIQQECHEDANIIFGTVIDETMGDHIRITVIATGFGNQLSRMKQKAKKDGVSPSFKSWSDTAQDKEDEDNTTIHDIFSDIRNEHPVQELPVAGVPDDKRLRMEPVISDRPNNTTLNDENDIAAQLIKGGKKSYDENALYAKKPSSPWGEIPSAVEPALGARATPPRISSRRTENNQERSDFKQILNDLNLSEGEADEFDIPAFLRRSAD